MTQNDARAPEARLNPTSDAELKKAAQLRYMTDEAFKRRVIRAHGITLNAVPMGSGENLITGTVAALAGVMIATYLAELELPEWKCPECGAVTRARMADQADDRPHSRACGWQKHDHGPACHSNCPTCGNQA